MPPYIRPALHHPTLDLPYASNLSYATLGQTYPMLPYTGPALCCPMLDLPYAGNLPYAALCWTFTLCRPTLTTYSPLHNYWESQRKNQWV